MTNNDHSGTYIKFLNLGDNFFSLYSCSDNLYCLGSSFLATATFEYSYDIFFGSGYTSYAPMGGGGISRDAV